MTKLIMIDDQNTYYDVKETLKLLGISYPTLYRWIKQDRITPDQTLGRNMFLKADIRELNAERDKKELKKWNAHLARLKNGRT